jgi:outer membrane protein assembly factor BamB
MDRTVRRLASLSLLLAATIARGADVGEQAALSSAGWPGYLGPAGNFDTPADTPLTDDISKAKLLWENLEHRVGFAKANTSAGKSGLGDEFQGMAPGGMASPIVSGGLVVQSYFAPRGEVFAADVAERMGDKFQKHNWLIDADDVVLALDAKTGKTAWKRVFEGRGMNTGAGKRGGWAVTPVAYEGRLFVLGSTGRVYAMDLKSGDVVWESDIGPAHQKLEAAKAKGLSQRRMPTSDHLYGFLVVVDGVLLCPNFSWGLVAIDPANGRRLWGHEDGGRTPILSNFNAPCPVQLNGKPYLATVGRTGELRLIEPRTGRILWTHPLKCEHLTQPVFGQNTLIVYESHPAAREGKDPNVNQIGLLAGYRLTERGAERAWALPDTYRHEMKLDAGPSRRVIPRNGKIYYLNRNKTADQPDRYTMLLLNEADGSVLANETIEENQFFLWGDKLVTVTDIQHRPRAANKEVWHVRSAATLKPSGSGWWVNQPGKYVHFATGGYELPIYEPMVDGFAFFRVMGGLRCYDLRPNAAE